MTECKHTRTHPRGCDDCPATWCYICKNYHVRHPYTNAESPFAAGKCIADLHATLDQAKRTLRLVEHLQIEENCSKGGCANTDRKKWCAWCYVADIVQCIVLDEEVVDPIGMLRK